MKKYIINSMPVMSRETVVYAKNPNEAWAIYWGHKEGKMVHANLGDLKFTDYADYVDPEIEEVKEVDSNGNKIDIRETILPTSTTVAFNMPRMFVDHTKPKIEEVKEVGRPPKKG